MIRDFTKNRSFTIEVETTSKCNFNCYFCDNRYDLTKNDGHKYKIDFKHLFSFIRYIVKFKQNIDVLLNGGEPILHDGLLSFCKDISYIDGCNVFVFTNMFAEDKLYVELMKYAKIVPTYHDGYLSFLQFAKKLQVLKITDVLLPITDINSIDMIQNFLKFGINAHPLLIENQKYSFKQINAFLHNSELKQQIKLKMSLKKHKICMSHNKYLYINGDGNIYRCMFNDKLKPLFNINQEHMQEFKSILNQMPYSCSNFCYYAF